MANNSFTLDLSRFAAKSQKQMSQVARKTAFGLFSAVQRGTPVDTGNARFSWFIDMNIFSNSVVNNRDGIANKSATAVEMDAKISAGLSRYKDGDTITFTNNSDHIETLEYGLYRVANSAKIVNHFSSQSPQGFVRLNLQKFQKYVKESL
jgi:hypothetical protein